MTRRVWLVIFVIALMGAMAGFWQWLAMGDAITPDSAQASPHQGPKISPVAPTRMVGGNMTRLPIM